MFCVNNTSLNVKVGQGDLQRAGWSAFPTNSNSRDTAAENNRVQIQKNNQDVLLVFHLFIYLLL